MIYADVPMKTSLKVVFHRLWKGSVHRRSKQKVLTYASIERVGLGRAYRDIL